MRSIWIVLLVAAAFTSSAFAQVLTSGPIVPSERQTSETTRNVSANEYRDAYCKRWTDGCVVCQRDSANEQPACRPSAGRDTACAREAVQCQALLRTTHRVCLSYSDGCNNCIGGSCTLMYCPIRLTDGTSRQKEANYQCTVPRRDRYDDPQSLRLDLQGHWRLNDPQGRSCEIVVSLPVSLSTDCIELGAPVTQVRTSKLAGSVFQLADSRGEALLSFETSNLEMLAGVEQSTGYRLMRLEAQPLDFRAWEGTWTLRPDPGGSSCDLFLTMQRRRIGPHEWADVIMAPLDVSFASNCLSSDNGSIRITSLDNAQPPVMLPLWRSWQVESHDITFRDESGRTTTFKRDREGTDERVWSAELPRPGYPPIITRLRPRR